MKRRSGYGWLELIIGVLLILLGVFSFIRPSEILLGVVIIYGIIAVLTGIADIVFYIKIVLLLVKFIAVRPVEGL